MCQCGCYKTYGSPKYDPTHSVWCPWHPDYLACNACQDGLATHVVEWKSGIIRYVCQPCLDHYLASWPQEVKDYWANKK